MVNDAFRRIRLNLCLENAKLWNNQQTKRWLVDSSNKWPSASNYICTNLTINQEEGNNDLWNHSTLRQQSIMQLVNNGETLADDKVLTLALWWVFCVHIQWKFSKAELTWCIWIRWSLHWIWVLCERVPLAK